MLKGYNLSIKEFNDLEPEQVKISRDTPPNKLQNITKAKVYDVVKTFQDMAMVNGDDGKPCFVDKQYLLIDE